MAGLIIMHITILDYYYSNAVCGLCKVAWKGYEEEKTQKKNDQTIKIACVYTVPSFFFSGCQAKAPIVISSNHKIHKSKRKQKRFMCPCSGAPGPRLIWIVRSQLITNNIQGLLDFYYLNSHLFPAHNHHHHHHFDER